ncbi:ABC transporter permease [Alsobacter sp. SYSU BS001988]|jgi:iron(III) transport system permease protein
MSHAFVPLDMSAGQRPPSLGRLSHGGRAPVVAAAVLVALLSLLPFGFVALIAVQTGWTDAVALVLRPRVGELLVNTVLLELCTLPPAIALAVATAWLTERTDLRFAPVWSWLAVAPLAVPAFVQSYAWTTLAPGMSGLWAATLVSVLAYSPFLYLPVAAQLRRLDPALEDAAASLGLDPWRVFFQVVLPQLRLGVCGGSLLVALHLLAEYGLYALVRYDTFTTAIMDQFQSAYNAPAANMMGGVLVLCCMGLLWLESRIRGDERYARLGPGAARVAHRKPLGPWAIPSMAGLALAAALSLGVPSWIIARWLAIGGAEVWGPAVASALGETLLLSLAGAVVTTLAAAPMAWLSVRAPGRVQRMLEACHYYVGSLPGVVVGLALVAVTVRVALPLYQTVATLLIAYALLFLPRAMAGLRPSLAQAPVELERAAMALGRTPFQAVCAITLRLAAPGAAASIALVTLGAATELTATLMLAPSGTRTLATAFWSLTGEIDYAAAAPYAAAMVVASLPLTLVLHAQSRRISGR